MTEKSTARKAADAVDKWHRLNNEIYQARIDAADAAEEKLRKRMHETVEGLDEDTKAVVKALLKL